VLFLLPSSEGASIVQRLFSSTRRSAIGWLSAIALTASMLASPSRGEGEENRLKVLFLGDNGHHKPAARAAELLPALARAGIDVAYTDDLGELSSANLARYDCLIIYANHDVIAPEQEEALLKFVGDGHGLVALHCASYCFRNSPRYVALVGGQFKSHQTGVFRVRIDRPDHPALKGVQEFEAWDETYTHTKLSDDRETLMTRPDGGSGEPWTWVRPEGKGRVFYTASGHDERVFTNPGFQSLVAQGVCWAAGKPEFTWTTAPFATLPAALPNYLEGPRTNPGRFSAMQAPLTVAESMRHISTPGGFRVALFAAEPDIVKPIAINWDDRGRAWIAETVDYPNDLLPPGQGHDRIKICEDTDGDGKADKFTVFAEGLSIPTSLVHAAGGLIVAQAPDMLFLQDTDGDDRADLRKVLFTGWGTRDTHSGPSNMRLGHDGWIYLTVGYSGFDGTVGGEHLVFKQAVLRMRPDGSKLEVLTSTSNNTWGAGLDETGEIVYSTANGEHSSYVGIPNRTFESVRGWLGKGNGKMADHQNMHPLTKIRQVDWFGAFTAAAGHAVYTARQFPRRYWNRMAFVAEPTGHLVHMDLLEPQGSGFITRDRFNLFASTDEWTSPIAAEVGPEGAVWVIDWYNYVVQHNPTPLGFTTGKGNAYETPLRDKTHGRIYRVIDETSAPGKTFDLAAASDEVLLEALQSDNMFWRMRAEWKIVEKERKEMIPALVALAGARKIDEIGEAPAALHALWALQRLGALERDSRGADVLAKVLRHPAEGVRKAALGTLPRTAGSVRAILDARLLLDRSPAVCRAALLALGEMPASRAAGAGITLLLGRDPRLAEDHWLTLAATSAAARHAQGFLETALPFPKDDKNGDLLRSAVRIVAEHTARGELPQTLDSLLRPLAVTADPGTHEAFLAGLAAGWPAGAAKAPVLDDRTVVFLIRLMRVLGPSGQLSLVTLAERWGLSERFKNELASVRAALAAEVSDQNRSEAERVAAARGLARMHPDREALGRLLGGVTAKASPALAAGLLDAAGQAATPELAAALIERWGEFTPEIRRQAIDILLRRPEWSRALLDALESKKLTISELGTGQAQQLAGHPDKAIAARAVTLLSQGGGLPNPDRDKVLQALLPLAEKAGNAARGLEVFKANCAKCHRHGDLGESIGPNLTGFAVHPKEKILTEVIDPNRSVEGNFRQYTVATRDGQIRNGLLAAETRTAIELVDGEAKKHVVLREDIDEIIASNKSLMPEGFEKTLTTDDLTDLLEFLSAKGKYFPLPLERAATIVSTLGMFYARDAVAERLILPDWSTKSVEEVPFQLIDPQGTKVPNVIMLHGPQGLMPPQMPGSVRVPCNARAKMIHLLSGVSGWGFPGGREGSVSMIVRLHYRDGSTEDHPLRNGVHFADYIRRVDVPGSKFAFDLRGRQMRYLTIDPERDDITIREIEFIKGDDRTAPLVMAVTIETP
jgi:putative membrane-bound dehydrogenase-like protein